MEQQTVDAQKTEEQTELSEEDREFLAHFARRIQDGDSLAEIFGMDDDDLMALEAQAYRLYRNRQFSQARVACRGILAMDDDRMLTQLMMGDMALEENLFSRAVEHLERAFELDPEQLVVRSRLGEALLKLGKSDQAREHLQAVVDAGDDAADYDRKRCQVLLDGLS